MTRYFVAHAFVALVYVASCVCADSSGCEVRARTDAGWVCGRRRRAENIFEYASFRGIPYAKQPLGELRFKELQPPEPWDGLYNATEEGLICPQKDVFYGRLMQPQGMGEACIHVNVHVPIKALPTVEHLTVNSTKSGLPILVFIHGGAFAYGSGDADVYGPEYLITKGVIVITFNYRLNVFGFLSLNSSSIPGNNGLRDMVTLLHWVQRNARNFGGDPDNVTLGGQSAGACCAHILSLSNAAEGLFKRVLMMSGTTIRPFYTVTPTYAQYIANQFLTNLGINSTDPEEIHSQLIAMPLENIMTVNSLLLDQMGVGVFFPVVESSFPNVTTILDDNPETLSTNGRGNTIPIITGFSTAECETFRPRFEEVDIMASINASSLAVLTPDLLYSLSTERSLELAELTKQKYFDGTPTLDKYIKCCSDYGFKYSTIKSAQFKVAQGEAPAYMYQFSYEAEHSVLKEALGLNYTGAGHAEDLTYVFRVNSMLGSHVSFPPKNKDDLMKGWMTTIVTNFMRCGNPTCDALGWPAEVTAMHYQDIRTPWVPSYKSLTDEQQSLTEFLDTYF